jgi:nucleoside-diphosphate-sugar epimerase
MKKILVLGGCGFIGTELVKALIKKNYNVTVVDSQWFGNRLIKSKNLNVIKKDIRNISSFSFKSFQAVIHLANIANDPSVELNPNLSWETNVLASYVISEKCRLEGVKQLIFSSSGSVYGIKKEKKVTEDLSLIPISIYNKTKMVAEKIFLSEKENLKIHCIRPATVCGYSDRMRLDVSVNMLTYQALKFKKMTVFGGSQVRPNINIKDIVRVFLHFIINPKIPSGCYNAGFENLTLLKIAKLIQKEIPSKIIITKNQYDLRSYRLNSDKLLKTGFIQKHNVIDAIKDIKEKYINRKFKTTDNCFTVKWMKKSKIK